MQTLLTVDDSAMMREIIAQAGEVVGCQVLQAASGEEALAVLDKNPAVNLVLLDWNMPGMNGLEVLAAIRADSRLDAVPVMMVTTESERDNILKALDQGAEMYITKPFVMEDLVTQIQSCLESGREET